MERFRLDRETRVSVAFGAFLILMLVLVGGLVNLQVIGHARLKAQSEENCIRFEPIIPSRGLVLDRQGRVIIDNRPSYTVSVVPLEETPVTVPNLAGLLELDTAEVRQRILRNTVNRYQPAPVKRDVEFPILAVIEEQKRRYPGVICQMERVRRYTEDLGAEVFTGYVGEVSRQEMKNGGTVNYRLGSMIGKKGLEKYNDLFLRGLEGSRYLEVSAAGQVLGDYENRSTVPAVGGADLVLTVDIDLQRASVQALDTFCCGAIVALDPRTGGVLAMTSYPGYDANIFSSVVPESLWLAISNDTTHPLLNRPLNGLYPPGSTVKFVGVGAALEEGIIDQHTTQKPCYGGMQFGNRYFRCWEAGGHGAVTAVHALEQSCDVFLYQLGLKLGIDKLSRYYDLCGFGHSTGIDLPGEAVGLNPNSDWYNEHYGEKQWTRALVLNNVIGQGELLVTPLQLARFFCGLANDGVVYRPHMVHKVVRPDGTEQVTEPRVAFRLPFSSETMALLREGMRLVVEGEKGTAQRLKNSRYSVGGKTGTAQNPHGEDHSWFVGAAPLEAPEIVVCAIVENAGHGSDVAAPVVGRIIEQYMTKTRPVAQTARGRKESLVEGD